MFSSFPQGKQEELKQLIANEQRILGKKIAAEEKLLEGKITQEIKKIKAATAEKIKSLTGEKNKEIQEKTHRQSQINLLATAFQYHQIQVGNFVENIEFSIQGRWWVFKTVKDIDSKRNPEVPGHNGLCTCGFSNHLRRSYPIERISIHCTCTITYIEELKKTYNKSQNELKEIIGTINMEITTLEGKKADDIQKYTEEENQQIEDARKSITISPEKKAEIDRDTKILEKINTLSKALNTPAFQNVSITDIINCKISTHSQCFEREIEEEPGSGHHSIELNKTKTLLNQLLKQAHRVHWDYSCFRDNGTPKAFNIIKKLAPYLVKMEEMDNPDDNEIYNMLRSACSLASSEQQENQNTLYRALAEPRRSAFLCCRFFTPSSPTAAEKAIRQTMIEIDHPTIESSPSLAHILRGRQPFAT